MRTTSGDPGVAERVAPLPAGEGRVDADHDEGLLGRLGRHGRAAAAAAPRALHGELHLQGGHRLVQRPAQFTKTPNKA